jgi:hypothetical protein
MAYRSDRVDIRQMSDELVTGGRTPESAVVELADALCDGAILLWFANELVVDELPDIIECLRAFAKGAPQAAGLASARWWTVFGKAQASREQFEAVCGFASAPQPVEPSRPASAKAGKYLTPKTVVDFVSSYIASNPNPTVDGLRNYAKEQHVIGGRELYEPEYRQQMKPLLGQVRPGRRYKIRED